MLRFNSLLLILSVGLTLPARATEPNNRPTQNIPIFSVSPGASGSVGSSSNSISRDVQQVPGVPSGVSSRRSTVSGSSSVRQSGGLRQSVEYPDGRRVQQPSVQDSFEQQRER
ncbi:MAG: hypothetical protein K2Y25_11800 [Pseudomonadaceae bacterium]|jgi:hypothetical protein|nr:hypothetical protein [Pseudomonadaceae bacterium]